MWDFILLPVKFWYTAILILLIADKIVAITPVPWDDIIVTFCKGVMDKTSAAINAFIASIIVPKIEAAFKKDLCCTDADCCCK